MELEFRIDISSSKRWLFFASPGNPFAEVEIYPPRDYPELERRDPGDKAWMGIIEKGIISAARRVSQGLEQAGQADSRLVITVTSIVNTLQQIEQLSKSPDQLSQEVAASLKAMLGLGAPGGFQNNLQSYVERMRKSSLGAADSQPVKRRKQTDITAWKRLPDQSSHIPLTDLLGDHQLGQPHKIFCLFENDVSESFSANQLTAALIFFQGMCIFFEQAEHGALCKRAHLFCAWQWFNLAKLLYLSARQENSSDAILKNIRLILSESYQALVHLLNSPACTSALHWLAKTNNWDEGLSRNADTTLRERVLRSLFLQRSAQPGGGLLRKVDLNKPLGAPGLQETRMDWKRVVLHPAFLFQQGKLEVTRFIHSFLLPHYDYSTALHLSSLLGSGQPHPRIHQTSAETAGKRFLTRILTNPWWMWCCVLLALSVIIGAGMFISARLQGLDTPPADLFVLNLLQVAILLCLLVLLMVWMGPNLLGYLSLPRLVGGVMVGYLALILQDNPGRLSGVIWGEIGWAGWVKSVLLILFVCVIGFTYLYFDIRPVLQNPFLAARRSLFILCLAVLVSAALGLIFVALGTEKPFDPGLLYFLGPLGWVDLLQYLVYVPLALFTGLVTQFIFEDKPLTAPVWSPEQPN